MLKCVRAHTYTHKTQTSFNLTEHVLYVYAEVLAMFPPGEVDMKESIMSVRKVSDSHEQILRGELCHDLGTFVTSK